MPSSPLFYFNNLGFFATTHSDHAMEIAKEEGWGGRRPGQAGRQREDGDWHAGGQIGYGCEWGSA